MSCATCAFSPAGLNSDQGDDWELVQARKKHLVIFTQKTLPASKNLQLRDFPVAGLGEFLFHELLQLPTDLLHKGSILRACRLALCRTILVPSEAVHVAFI